MEPRIGIENEQRKQLQSLLNKLLADEYVLYTKTLNYHWNVKGPDFDSLHLFFKRLYEQLFDIVDAVAERTQTIGHRAAGSLLEFSEHTRLSEQPGIVPGSALEMIRALLDDHETIIRSLRSDVDRCAEELHDMGTSNFLTDLLEQHEKIAWMLRSSLE